jgi:hypothetical protein
MREGGYIYLCNLSPPCGDKQAKYSYVPHFESSFAHSPVEGDEVSVHGDVLYDPVGEGDLADVDELAAADRVLDGHVVKLLVEKSVRKV